MPDIRAAGFVVYRRRAGEIEYLALQTRRTGEWGFAKGHNERGECDLDTAWRETEEETGLGHAQLVRNPWWERRIDYPVKKGDKTVFYGLAECTADMVTLSSEHAASSWAGLADALNLLLHENLRAVLRAAAVFLKDPALRIGLDATQAKALLQSRFEAGEPVLAHTAVVSEMARAMADEWSAVDAEYTECCAWLHDIGRSVQQGRRHPIEGFYLLDALGHPGYAPTCISHYARGRSHDELANDELWRACDLSTFEPHERIVALADFLAVHDSKATIEQRHADLVARYGASAFLDGSLAIARALKEEFEQTTGRELYGVAGVNS